MSRKQKMAGKRRLSWMFSNIYKINSAQIFMKKGKLSLLFLLAIFSLTGILAQTNASYNQTAVSDNQTAQGILLTNFMPQEVKLGDVQFNLQIQNNNNETASNIIAFVTGNGFSTYDMLPIDSLASGDKSYIFIYGNLKQAGNITLTIKISDKNFYQNISVIDPNAESDQQKIDDIRKQQEKEQLIKNISDQLDILKQNFTILEDEIAYKQSNNYDVSLVNLNILNNYLHNIQADILTGNVNDAEVNLNLAYGEYATQKRKLDNAKEIPLVNILKNNVLLFSTFAGAIITFFALYELLKVKREKISKVIRKKIRKKKE